MIGFWRRIAAAVAAASLLLATVSAAQAAGAFAVGACGAYGYAYDYKQMAAARTAAAQKCSGTSCKIVGAIRRGCAALAVEPSIPAARMAGRSTPISAKPRTRPCTAAINTAATIAWCAPGPATKRADRPINV
jgi:hypothetical protein